VTLRVGVVVDAKRVANVDARQKKWAAT